MSRSIVFENSMLKKRSLMRWVLSRPTVNNMLFQAWVLKNGVFRNRKHPSHADYLALLGDQLKERYDEKLDVWTDLPGDREPARWFFDRLPAGDHNLLDIGTGRARDLEEFLRRGGHRATGLDLFEVSDWSGLRERWGDKLTLAITPFLEFQPRECYSAVFSLGAYGHQHPDDYAAFLSHTQTLMKPGGLFMLCVLHQKNERGPGRLIYQDDRFWKFFSTEEIRTHLERAGFTWIESYTHHDSFFPYLMTLSSRTA